MQDRHQAVFEKLASRLTAEFDTVKKIILFGSVARGSHGAESDIDLLILVSNLSQREEIEETVFDAAVEEGISITPIIVTPDTDNHLVRTAEEEGIEYVPG